MTRSIFMWAAVFSFGCLVAPRAAAQRPVRILIGTAAPEGSVWHDILLDTKAEWERIAGDQLNVRVFAGGTQGDETAMLDRVRLGTNLQAVALSGAGLAQADPGVSALQIPMLYSSYEELDYVFERLRPTLEQRLDRAGYVVLHWADVGWVHFFTKERAREPDDIRTMRLFTTAGDADTERLWRDARFQPVPMAVTDMVTNLASGLIEAFDVPPLFALVDQSFASINYMLDLKWAPLLGATLIDKDTWERIPSNLRGRMLQAAHDAAEARKADIRRLGDDAVAAMVDRGLEVVPVDPALESLWRREVESVWPTLRGGMVPADLFDEARSLVEEYRNRNR